MKLSSKVYYVDLGGDISVARCVLLPNGKVLTISGDRFLENIIQLRRESGLVYSDKLRKAFDNYVRGLGAFYLIEDDITSDHLISVIKACLNDDDDDDDWIDVLDYLEDI
jgi:hypothetical protein